MRGNGARTLYVFSDPACQYCRRLEPELAKLQDVTIYTFVVPFLGRQLPQSVLCAADPAKAWQALMVNGDSTGLAPQAECRSPIDRNLALARQLGVSGTPTLFYADGSRTAGYVGVAEVERRIAVGRRCRAPQVSAPSVTRSGEEPMKHLFARLVPSALSPLRQPCSTGCASMSGLDGTSQLWLQGP